jgi:hypothetical protein
MALVFTPNQLGIGALGTILTTQLYVVTSSTKAIGITIVLTNTGSSTRNITIKVGPSTKRAVLSARPLAAGDTLVLELGSTCLLAADVIQGGQDTGTDVDYIISGVEVT